MDKLCWQNRCIGLTRKFRSTASLVGSKSSLFDINRSLSELLRLGQIDEARKLFERMPRRDEFTWNTMVSGYADLGRLNEASEVFDETPNKSSIIWSSLISGYCKYGYEAEGFQMFWEMQHDGHKPSQFTLGIVLRMCSVKSLLSKGKQIHGYAIKTNYDANLFVITGLIDMYAKCLCVMEAELLFEAMPSGRNHVTWTAMINGYSLNGNAHKTIQCFRGMRGEGVEANQYTFPGVLTACAAVSDIKFGIQVHCCIVQGGFEANVFVHSALVDTYAKCGDLHSARNALESMEVDHVISWNSMIVGYARNGFEEEALLPFKVMHGRSMGLDDFTYPSVLNCLASKKDVKIGQSVHCLVVKTGFEGYKLISNALVDMYAKQGDISSAFKMFKTIWDRDVISWTSVVTGCAHNDSHEVALKLFCEMRNSGVEPDQVVISSILSSCAELALLEFGQQVHANFIKYGLGSSLSVDNSLVTMYANCGCLEEANRVFKSMDIRNVITWPALIAGYAQNGKGKESLRLYDEMKLNGVEPDFITFIGILFASHAGLVDQGRRYFESMVNVYKIKPCPDHYACMIDLLGRAGKLHDTEKLLNEMAVEPDATVWKALLAACREHRNIDLVKKAASALFKLTPRDAVPYVMLSNMYSAAGKWEDAAAVRKLMKSKSVNKGAWL